MIEKLKLSRSMLLPENETCDHCADSLVSALTSQPGLDRAHRDERDQICLHYDPSRWQPESLERTARLMGAEVQQQFRHSQWEIAGLDCGGCAATVEKGIASLGGVVSCRTNLATSQVVIEWRDGAIDETHLRGALADLGHAVVEPVVTLPGTEQEARTTRWRARLLDPTYASIALSGLAFVLGLLLEWAGAEQAAMVAFAAALLSGGWQAARTGVRALVNQRRLTVDLLMTIAAVGAVLLGEWAEGAAVVFLFALGETLEALSMERARRSIRSLMALAPNEATRMQGGETEVVPVEALTIGDRLLVRPGERVPMDGVVLAGQSAVNQAPITGESLPVEKEVGDSLFAGSINGDGALELRVTRRARDNMLARIVTLVQEAQSQKAGVHRFVDRFAEVYTPLVVLGAALLAILPPLLLGWAWGESVRRALVLLVISCPCALVISTPVSIISAVSNAARRGVLVKGGASLEALGTVRAVAFDKTGTLTQGRPELTDLVLLAGQARGEALALAAGLEGASEHPIAKAIVGAAQAEGLRLPPVRDFKAEAGRGASGLLADGRRVTIGRPLGLDGAAATTLATLEAQGKTVVLLALEGVPQALLAVADTVRPEARAVLATLRAEGVERVVMLTGDNPPTAHAIAATLGIPPEDVRAGLLPDGKVEALRELLGQHGQVAMVGDGINDAPALALATVGIAMGAAGTDQALEVADVALMADELTQLPFALQLGRETRRVIRQNIAFAIGVKLLFMLLAIPGFTTLWLAIFADDGASLLVTGNGMRLLKVGRTEG